MCIMMSTKDSRSFHFSSSHNNKKTWNITWTLMPLPSPSLSNYRLVLLFLRDVIWMKVIYNFTLPRQLLKTAFQRLGIQMVLSCYIFPHTGCQYIKTATFLEIKFHGINVLGSEWSWKPLNKLHCEFYDIPF